MANKKRKDNMIRVDGSLKSPVGHQGPIVYRGKTKVDHKGEKYTKDLTVMTEKSLEWGGGKEPKTIGPGITKGMHPAELQYLAFTGKLSEGQKQVAKLQTKKFLNKGLSAFYPNAPLKRKK